MFATDISGLYLIELHSLDLDCKSPPVLVLAYNISCGYLLSCAEQLTIVCWCISLLCWDQYMFFQKGIGQYAKLWNYLQKPSILSLNQRSPSWFCTHSLCHPSLVTVISAGTHITVSTDLFLGVHICLICTVFERVCRKYISPWNYMYIKSNVIFMKGDINPDNLSIQVISQQK